MKKFFKEFYGVFFIFNEKYLPRVVWKFTIKIKKVNKFRIWPDLIFSARFMYFKRWSRLYRVSLFEKFFKSLIFEISGHLPFRFYFNCFMVPSIDPKN